MFVLPELPYGYGDLAPIFSDRTMRSHHDKHHAAYVKTTNELLGSRIAPDSLEEVVREAARGDEHKKLFNNAAQAWNHGFFWVAMAPRRGEPGGELASHCRRIRRSEVAQVQIRRGGCGSFRLGLGVAGDR